MPNSTGVHGILSGTQQCTLNSAVKRLIASKIIVFVYTYMYVYCVYLCINKHTHTHTHTHTHIYILEKICCFYIFIII